MNRPAPLPIFPAIIPRHTEEFLIRVAQEKISNRTEVLDEDPKSYEHHVGTWACSMLARHFNNDNFLITPEANNRQTNEKPDFTIEKYDEENEHTHLKHHAYYEIKKFEGETLYKALDQVIKAIKLTGDETQKFASFVIVQRGLKIGFFEFHSFEKEEFQLEKEKVKEDMKIENFRGCVSLTYHNKRLVWPEGTDDRVKNLSREIEGLEFLDNVSAGRSSELREEADLVTEECIFNLDLDQHREKVDLLFQHIVHAEPRDFKLYY